MACDFTKVKYIYFSIMDTLRNFTTLKIFLMCKKCFELPHTMLKCYWKLWKIFFFVLKVIIPFSLHSSFTPMQLLWRRILFNFQWKEFLDDRNYFFVLRWKTVFYPLEGSPEIKYCIDAILQYIRLLVGIL